MRLMHASNPAHRDLATLRAYKMVPMKPRTPKNIPTDEMIWNSNSPCLPSSENQKRVQSLVNILACNSLTYVWPFIYSCLTAFSLTDGSICHINKKYYNYSYRYFIFKIKYLRNGRFKYCITEIVILLALIWKIVSNLWILYTPNTSII